MHAPPPLRERFCILTFLALTCTANICSAGNRWWVGNEGADSSTCGSQAHPCRSISQAIEMATDGDKIFVGPGRYGDVSGTGTYSGPGDEHPGPTGCLVCITKALQISSVAGPSVTVIQVSPTVLLEAAVQILHDGVVFGYQGHGFTLAGGSAGGNDTGGVLNGVWIDEGDPNFQSAIPAGITQGISVGGNFSTGIGLDGTGSAFAFNGPGVGPLCPPEGCPANTGQVLFADNQAVGSGFSVTVNALFGPGLIILRNNLALGAAAPGFQVAAGHQLRGSPDVLGASQVQLLNNVAAGCQLGFATNLAGAIQHNTASANALAGFLLVPQGPIQYNSAIGNGGPGMILQFSPDDFTPGPSGGAGVIVASINNNNFFGNDRNRVALTIGIGDVPNGAGPLYDPGPSAHCGILNVGELEPTLLDRRPAPTITVAAHFDYWGSTKGPQASGPGDTVGGACDQNGGVTQAIPFSVTPLTVSSFQP